MTKRTQPRKELPTCPTCGATRTKTLGGGTYPKYRYACKSCNATWQQVPTRRAGAGARIDVRISTNSRRCLKPYRCSVCLQRKEKGHKAICPGFADASGALADHGSCASRGGGASSSSSGAAPRLVARDDWGFDDDGEEDALTDAAARFSEAKTAG